MHRIDLDRGVREIRLRPGRFEELRFVCPPGYRPVATGFQYFVGGRPVETGTLAGEAFHNVVLSGRTATFRAFVRDRGDVRLRAYVECAALRTPEGRLEHVHSVLFRAVSGHFPPDAATGGNLAQTTCNPRFWAAAYAASVLDRRLFFYIQEAAALDARVEARTARLEGFRAFGQVFGVTVAPAPNPTVRFQVICAPQGTGRSRRKRRPRLPLRVAGAPGRHAHRLRPTREVRRTASLPPGARRLDVRCPPRHLATAPTYGIDPTLWVAASFSRGRSWRLRLVNTGSERRTLTLGAVCLPVRLR